MIMIFHFREQISDNLQKSREISFKIPRFGKDFSLLICF